MKTVTLQIPHTKTGETTQHLQNVYEPGDKIWVQIFGRVGRYKNACKVKQLIVSGQEWWESNDKHPVYYDLTDPVTGETVGCSPTGNWHFGDLFETEKAAIEDIIKFLQNDIRYFEKCLTNGQKLNRDEQRKYARFQKLLPMWLKRIEEV